VIMTFAELISKQRDAVHFQIALLLKLAEESDELGGSWNEAVALEAWIRGQARSCDDRLQGG